MKIINILPVSTKSEFELNNNIAKQYSDFYQEILIDSEAWVLSSVQNHDTNSVVFKATASHPNKAISFRMLIKCIFTSKGIFHIHGYNSIQARLLVIVLLILRRKFIINYHGSYFLKDDLDSKSLVKRFYAHFLIKKMNFISIVCINLEQFRYHQEIDSYSIFAPMPINETYFQGTCEQIQLAERDYDGVYVGRISREKRFDELLNVFFSSSSESSRFALIIACTSEQETSLRNRLRSTSNIDLFVNLKPTEVKEVLQRSKIICLNSTSEGLNRSLLEGLSVGCSFLATRNRGNETILDTIGNGTLVSRINSENLNQVINDYSCADVGKIRTKLQIFGRIQFLEKLQKLSGNTI